jgi:ribonucleoside-diphosphate reductase alpha chain
MILKTPPKVGLQQYLGLVIDYNRDKNFEDFGLATLQDRYFWKDEESPQQAFARAAVFSATYRGETDYDLAQRLYEYASNFWFMFSTPLLSNGGTTRGLPISCFLNYVPDSREGLFAHYEECGWLASAGGGIGGYWGDVRSNGVATSSGSRSTGSIPFMHMVDSEMLAFNQGTTRRGSYAAYSNINHPEIEEFIAMRKPTGGDLNRKSLNLHHGVLITNEFLQAVKEDQPWRLIDPKSLECLKTISARSLWWQLIQTRFETGEPYIVNIDTCNEYLPKEQKNLGLKIQQSNLCSEITLATDEERTAVCCLSSVNLEYYDEWSKSGFPFIADLVTMLDNVLEYFIESVVDTKVLESDYNANFRRFKNYVREGKEGFTRSAYSAYRERSIGLGAMGFHSYLQNRGFSFGEIYASSFNHKAFQSIKQSAVEASIDLAKNRGEAPDMAGSGKRNAHLLAVAPNASSSIICGGTSPSIEPSRANVYTHKTLSGSFQVKNKVLEKIMIKKGLKAKERADLWSDIVSHQGSIQHLIDIFDEDEREVFKTAPEINQLWVIEHAKNRQPFLCQSQSVNLFFVPPPTTEEQEIHDEFLQYVNDVHWAAAHKLKSLYYLRSDSVRGAENVNIKIPRINLEDVECLSCEG